MAKGLQEGVASLDLAEIVSTTSGSEPQGDSGAAGADLGDLPETRPEAVSAPPSIYDRVTYSRPSADLPPLLERPDPSRSRQVAGALAAAVVVVAVLALIFYPTTNDRYIRDLKSAGLLVQFPSHHAAITAGRDVCSGLDQGARDTGTPADLIAVRHYCPAFADGFIVTPAGQPTVITPAKTAIAGTRTRSKATR